MVNNERTNLKQVNEKVKESDEFFPPVWRPHFNNRKFRISSGNRFFRSPTSTRIDFWLDRPTSESIFFRRRNSTGLLIRSGAVCRSVDGFSGLLLFRRFRFCWLRRVQILNALSGQSSHLREKFRMSTTTTATTAATATATATATKDVSDGCVCSFIYYVRHVVDVGLSLRYLNEKKRFIHVTSDCLRLTCFCPRKRPNLPERGCKLARTRWGWPGVKRSSLSSNLGTKWWLDEDKQTAEINTDTFASFVSCFPWIQFYLLIFHICFVCL